MRKTRCTTAQKAQSTEMHRGTTESAGSHSDRQACDQETAQRNNKGKFIINYTGAGSVGGTGFPLSPGWSELLQADEDGESPMASPILSFHHTPASARTGDEIHGLKYQLEGEKNHKNTAAHPCKLCGRGRLPC